jgi:hypothetical protein
MPNVEEASANSSRTLNSFSAGEALSPGVYGRNSSAEDQSSASSAESG